MPLKRRHSSIGRKTPNSQRVQRHRDNETEESRTLRQLSYRDLHATNRTNMQLTFNSRNNNIDWLNAAFVYDKNLDYSSSSKIQIGQMVNVCKKCNAKKWPGEAPGMCCSGGKIKLPALNAPPDVLLKLLIEDVPKAKQFKNIIWKYNASFMMTSFGADRDLTDRGFFTTYKIQGVCYHRIGGLLPLEEEKPKYVQVFFMGGGEQEAEQRCILNHGVQHETILELQEMLHATHPYVQSFKSALEQIDIGAYDHKLVIRAEKRPAGEHARRFNAPVSNEVAIVMVGEQYGNRDIVLRKRDHQLMRISETHRSYDSLQYPLMFPRGEDGYNLKIFRVDPVTGQNINKTVSCKDFYAYRFMIRPGEFNQVLRFKQVTSQFIVDMYAKMESERLLYIRLHQKQLRADDYIHLRDALNSDGNVQDVGQKIILPSSFTGGPRYMHERTQDAMAYVRKHGRPDLFITFTCNPKWQEIIDELFPGQTQYDRHDLIARVFHEKQKKLLWLLKDGKIFGELICWMYTIEWQKRGLPHSHTLIWCKEKIHPDNIDNIISAELPCPDHDPELHNIIKTQMVHGPCGNINISATCMQDGRCTKRYPHHFLQDSKTGHDGYPLYRRRPPGKGGYTCQLKVRGGAEVEVDNQWVVPHNKLLCKTFGAHINVEYCSSVKSIKYICKYVNKGSDMAVFGVEQQCEQHDEIKQYQTGRYVSSNEGIWRILGFDIHHRHPTVVNLAVHLENGQRVYFTEDNALERVRTPPETTLTAFFKLCQQDTFARTLLYHEVPTYYTWSNKKWSNRKQGNVVPGWPHVRASDAIGRLYGVHPNQLECYYLRLLLNTLRGPLCFADLRTYNNHICTTYREACAKHGLLEDDRHWHHTLEDAAMSQAPAQLRQLFAIMLQTCALPDPLGLWELHKQSMAEDYLHRVQRQYHGIENGYQDEIFNKVLLDLQKRVRSMGAAGLANFGLPDPKDPTENALSAEYLQETDYDPDQLAAYLQENEPRLVDEQQQAVDAIMKSIDSEKGGIFFLDAPGGTGKTFVTKIILAKVRKQRKIALAVASSGIAATLLDGGRTAHSVFKLPLDLTKYEAPQCNIKRGTSKATLLRECKVIIWDEATMSHKRAFEAVDRMLQDIRYNNLLMGGITVVLSGDFRQTLPVISRATRADEIDACVKASYLWPHIQLLCLKRNMRASVSQDRQAGEFSRLLLQVGNGKLSDQQSQVQLPFGNQVDTEEALIEKVFPSLISNYTNPNWLSERAILSPKNDVAESINSKLLRRIPDNVSSFKSIDTVVEPEEAVNYPTEFLNSLNPPGLPPHTLELKRGAPIILLRNLDAPKLCNGTRLVVKQMTQFVLEATILTGKAKGENTFIPRIPLIPSDMPFEFRRLQFPVKLSFAMSINKSQGQTLKVVGLNLIEPVFSHGQLYVGCSRVGNPDKLFVLTKNGKTKNIVYQEVLQNDL